MRKQQGFTLIELVVVIIILGILAVVAAPKFLNLQSDARVSALQGLKGAIQGANSLVYSKAALAGKEKLGKSTIKDNQDQTIDIVYGYLPATIDGLKKGADIDLGAGSGPTAGVTNDWIINVTAGTDDTAGTATIWQKGAPADADGNTCSATYTEATSKSLPSVVVVTTGC
ncbi:prepilin-type N-terminal cleavage/methylation domain-containing protein [Shewanella dokdonensis]|uniref:Type II secretion system protein n=1 Tax=Shewanella dokdonensis TaxID=712036 RepID=A0ABX8DB12_9GAMM|nr:type II secretion system protein [Shewanella dokdonensis]MCL1075321.1 type II secretion system GspH family protein [Shewanella dokdonensis]QVK22034.1 type II secretion system protein [Shewanella dokdonensis]